MKPGCVYKCYAIYDKPFWRENGFSGMTFSTDELITFSLDCSPTNLSKGILMGFVLAENAREKFIFKTEEERKTEILKIFAKYFGE
jgi:monoamine oxidase